MELCTPVRSGNVAILRVADAQASPRGPSLERSSRGPFEGRPRISHLDVREVTEREVTEQC